MVEGFWLLLFNEFPEKYIISFQEHYLASAFCITQVQSILAIFTADWSWVKLSIFWLWMEYVLGLKYHFWKYLSTKKVSFTLEGSDLSDNFHPKHFGSNHGLCGCFNKCFPESKDYNGRVQKTITDMEKLLSHPLQWTAPCAWLCWQGVEGCVGRGWTGQC